MKDRNQITAYFKETNKRLCQFYINAIMMGILAIKELIDKLC